MPRRTSPLTPLLVPLLAMVLLSGCSEEAPEPKFAPTPTAEPTPVEQEETAEEFIRRWNDEQNTMLKGDTSAWRQMTADCKSCIASADRVDEYYAADGYIRTDGRTVLSVERMGDGPTKSAPTTFRVRIDSAPTRYRSSASSPEGELTGGISLYEVELVKRNGDWTFRDYWEVEM